MSQKDYEAGRSGAPAGSNTNYAAHDQGVRDRELAQQSLDEQSKNKRKGGDLSSGPKMEVSGAGVTLLIFFPLLYIAYPVGGLVNLGAIYIVWAAVSGVFDVDPAFEFGAGIIAGIFFIGPAFRIEGFVNGFGLYRALRHVFRVGIFGLIIFSAVNSSNRLTGGIYTPEYEIPYTAIFWFAVTVVAAHFITRLFDRLLFPVTSRAIEPEAQNEAEEYTEPLVFGIPHVIGVIFIIGLLLFLAPVVNPVYGILVVVVVSWLLLIRRRRRLRKKGKLLAAEKASMQQHS